MQDRIARIDETSCTARPDHTVGSIASWPARSPVVGRLPQCPESGRKVRALASVAMGQSTKSLCDIGGCGLVLSAVPRKEIVDGGAPRMIGHRTIRNFTPKNSSAMTHNKSFR